ncbi:MFS general substrate transporter [Piromyces finnis]|uniref:MFS general substrate transporter n=1 Tax=Piromyces finnis TaxID=1754191 RepID=A0A1Y1VJK8_9FUNG|nr:MFS general substrate transporter [Piromyces finnis]|eukprot:ORX57900.1 MFS general substrate transporter [Piromyces finnis]
MGLSTETKKEDVSIEKDSNNQTKELSEKEHEELTKKRYMEISDKKRSQIFINVNISCIAGIMLQTALTTALPPIIKDFNISVNTGQWLTSGFSLAMSIMIPLTSFLITRFRTRRLFLSAIGLFLTGLTIALFSVNFYMMLVGRVIQAFGSGLLSSMAQVIILTIYPPERRGSAMGWYGLSVGAAPVIAPTIAGILADSVGWRMIFVVSIAIMAITLIYTLFVFTDCLPNKKVKFDAFSFILSALTFGGITLAVGNFGTYDFVSYQVLMVLIIGLVASVIFVYRQLHAKSPFLDISVLKHKSLAIAAMTTIAIQLIIMGSAVIFPLYFQQVKGCSATISGLAVLPGSLSLAIISPFAGKIYDKMGIKVLFLFAGIFSTLSNLVLYFITINTNIWVVAAINIVRCISLGVLTMPVITWGMSRIPASKTTDGSATINSFRIVSGAIGTALFVSVMTTVTNFVKDTKKEPQLYGINFVFLCMAILSFIILLFGIFGCDSKFTLKSKEEKSKKIPMEEKINENDENISKEEELNEVEVIVDNKKSQPLN